MSVDLMKENDFTLTKARSRQYPIETIMDTDYTDVILFLANTPVQAESLLHSLEKAVNGIGLHVIQTKQNMCFNQNQKSGISTL